MGQYDRVLIVDRHSLDVRRHSAFDQSTLGGMDCLDWFPLRSGARYEGGSNYLAFPDEEYDELKELAGRIFEEEENR